MKKILILFLLLLPSIVRSQDGSTSSQKNYWKSASELIFSWGNVKDGSKDISSVIRFSMFFHFQEQYHIDMNEHFGVWLGFGIRNVGMINDISDSVKLKQRSYSFGVPIAFKIGNLPKNMYASIGGEAELMFHYKQKAFYDDTKYRKSEWFSDRTNLINPSVFLDLNFKKGAYIRFKYYLLDFLVENKQTISVDGTKIDYTPEQSQLFYVAFGMALNHKDKHPKVVIEDAAYSMY
ncbi:MAG TPA: hypothetical protein VFW78_01130 [Bacteroidia bacterium]|nr:hypothetical protein [Bacteroidia bacterium]